MTDNAFYTIIEKSFQIPPSIKSLITDDGFLKAMQALCPLLFQQPEKDFCNFPYYKSFVPSEFFSSLNSYKNLTETDSFLSAAYIYFCRKAYQFQQENKIPQEISKSTLVEVARLALTKKDFDYRFCAKYLVGAVLRIGSLDFQPCENPYSSIKGLPCGDLMIRIHVPNGADLSMQARNNAYNKAFSVFSKGYGKDSLYFVCESWLLADYNQQLKNSRIADFSRDFTICETSCDKELLLRVFGKNYKSDPQTLEEKTSLQRLYKERLLSNKEFFVATGYFIMEKTNERKYRQ